MLKVLIVSMVITATLAELSAYNFNSIKDCKTIGMPKKALTAGDTAVVMFGAPDRTNGAKLDIPDQCSMQFMAASNSSRLLIRMNPFKKMINDDDVTLTFYDSDRVVASKRIMQVSKKSPFPSGMSQFFTTSNHLTVEVMRDYATSKDYDVEFVVQPDSKIRRARAITPKRSTPKSKVTTPKSKVTTPKSKITTLKPRGSTIKPATVSYNFNTASVCKSSTFKVQLDTNKRAKIIFRQPGVNYGAVFNKLLKNIPDECKIQVQTTSTSKKRLQVSFDSSKKTINDKQASITLYNSDSTSGSKLVTVSKDKPLGTKKTFTTKGKYLTVKVKRDYDKSKNYDVEMTIEAVSSAATAKWSFVAAAAALIFGYLL